MPTTKTKRSALVKSKLKEDGFRSLYAACREKKVDYQLALRAIRGGLTEKSTLKTVADLERLGILHIVQSA